MPNKKRTGRRRIRRRAKGYGITRKLGWTAGKPAIMYKPVIVPYRCGKFNCFGLPSCLYTKLRYVDYHTLAPTNAASDSFQYRINDLYDPNYTTTGAQPYGRDQIISIGYTRYQVMACKVECTFSIKGDGEPAMCSIRPSIANTTPASIEAEIERQYSRSGVCPAGGKLVLKGYYKIHQIFGKTKMQYFTDNDFNPLSTASPTVPCWLNVSARDLVTNQLDGVGFMIRLTFYCRWTELPDMPPS